MVAIDFPVPSAIGQKFTAGGVTYTVERCRFG